MPLTTTHRRALLLLAATTVSLSSGTNYVFSAYAPQLATRLNLSSTQLNLIGIAGNLGVYTSGPVWGVFIDRNGPRGVLCWAAVLILAGYTGIRWIYLHPSAGHHEKAPSTTVASLSLCMLMTGYAASAGLNSSLNTVARSFPSSSRATASGITLAGFGLSAFLFSTLAQRVFPGRTDAFLGLLAVGTALGMGIGVVGVRPVVDEPAPGYVRVVPVDEEDGEETSYTDVEDSGRLRLVPSRSRSADRMTPASDLLDDDELEEEEDTKSIVQAHVVSVPSPTAGLEITGSQLLKNVDFWIIVGILTLLSGTGLMYINNVGSVVLALANASSPSSAPISGKFDGIEVARVQATQVSVISVWNCLGRISMGMLSDYAKTRFGINRVWFTLLIALIFLASQVSAQMTQDMYTLSRVSGLLGMAYGNLFALLPIVVLEWFGLSNFSMNWGIVSLAPGLGGNVANLIFGRIYDSNVREAVETTLLTRTVGLFARGGAIPDPSDHTHDCILGTECYATAFRITTVWCSLALGLGLFLAVRQERKSREERHRGADRKWSAVDAEEVE